MSRQFRLSPAKRVAMIVALLLFWSCAAIDLLGMRTPSAAARAEGLGQAQQRWAARPFTHYRMVAQAPSWCRMDLEVKNERVITTYQNTCPGAPQTVSDLFASISQINSQADTVYCAPSGCECTEQRFASAVYDPQLGFPRTISLRRSRATNWTELWHYFRTHGLPNCLTPLDTDLVRVISLQPLA